MGLYGQGQGGNITYTVGYGCPNIEQVRQVVREEVHKALHPEEARPSATVTVEFGMHGKLYRGTVYQVEEDEED